MFRRVRDLLRSLPAPSEMELNLRRLEGIIERMTEAAVRQAVLTRDLKMGTTRARLLSRELRLELMRPVVLVARSILAERGPNGESLRNSLRAPRARDIEGLISSAEGLARLIEENQEVFVAEGLSEQHAARLVEKAQLTRAAVDARGRAWSERRFETRTAEQLTRDGSRQVRILESMLEPAFRADESLRAGWRSAALVMRQGVGSVEGDDAGEGRGEREVEEERGAA